MTKPISDRDWEAISAYLDGELNPKDRVRLDARLQTSAELRAALEDMRRTRAVLRSQPRMRAPRNFTLSAQAYSRNPERRPGLRLSPVFAMVSALASLLFIVVVAGELLTTGPQVQTMPLAAQVIQEEAPAEAAAQADQPGPVAPEAQPVPTEEIMLAQEGEDLSSKAAQLPPALLGTAEAYPPPTLAASSAAMVYPPPAEQVQGAVEAPLPEATPVLEESAAARSSAGDTAEPAPTEGLAQSIEPQDALQEAPSQGEVANQTPSQPSGGIFSGWRFIQLILILLALVCGTIAFLLRRSGT